MSQPDPDKSDSTENWQKELAELIKDKRMQNDILKKMRNAVALPGETNAQECNDSETETNTENKQ